VCRQSRKRLGRTEYGRELATAWLSLFGLLALFALFAFLGESDRKDAIATVAARGQEQALLLSEHSARLFEAAEMSLSMAIEEANDLSGPTETQSFNWNAISRSAPLWRRMERLTQQLPYVDAFWLCGPDGRLRLSTLAFPAPFANMHNRPFFLAHQAGDTAIIVGDLTTGKSGLSVFRLSKRLESGDGRFQGVASVTIKSDYFNHFYSALHLPPGSTVALLRTTPLSSLIRAVVPGGYIPPPMADSDELRRAQAADPNRGQYTVTDGNNNQRAVAYRAVPGFPLFVKVGIPINALSGTGLSGQPLQRLITRTMPAAAAVLALALLTWVAFRQAGRQRAFQEELATRVAERTADLEATNARMATLLQELHHRVNNNLQIVESLLAIQAARMTNADARAALAPSIGRVHAIALVHRNVYGGGGMSELLFRDYLNTLITHLPDIYGAGATHVSVSGANPVMGLEMAVPLALVVHEALSNVMRHAYPRHAYPDGIPAAMAADITIEEDAGAWLLTVADYGQGLPEGFDWTRGDGLGLTIARSLAAQLGGEVHLTSTPTGTRFELRFPKQEATRPLTPMPSRA
jgi:two-component system, sensor histidine kinase PdtaS